jgi:LEA14-like dessication related protein
VAILAVACQIPQKPEFQGLEDVEFRGAVLDGSLVLMAEAIFENPNGFGVDVTELEMDVFVDDRQAAHIRQTLAAIMPAGGRFAVPVEIDIPLETVYEDAGDLLSGLLSEKQVQIRLDGWIRVEAMGFRLTVPLSHEETYQVDL